MCPVLGMSARIESQHLHVDGNDDRWPSAASELKLLRNLAAVAKQREQPAEVCLHSPCASGSVPESFCLQRPRQTKARHPPAPPPSRPTLRVHMHIRG